MEVFDAERAHMRQMARDFPTPPNDILIYACRHDCHALPVLRRLAAFRNVNPMGGERPPCPECSHPANQGRMNIESGRWVDDGDGTRTLIATRDGRTVT